MVKVCILKSCSSGRKRVKKRQSAPHSLSFFQPRSQMKLETWSKSLGLELRPTDFICHLHFKANDIKFYETVKIGDVEYLSYLDKKLLKEDALPTVQHQFKIRLQKDLVHMHLQQVDEQQDLVSEQLCVSTDSEDIEQEAVQQCELDEVVDDQQTLVDFKNKVIDAIVLPPYWFYVEKPKQIDFMRVDPKSEQIKHHIRLNEDLSTTVIYANKEEFNLNKKMKSVDDVSHYLKFVEKWPVCVGTQIEKIMYSKKCKGVIVGEDAYKRLQVNPRCKACRVLRSRFQSRPFARLTTTERIAAQKKRIQTLEKQCRRLKVRVNKFKDLKLPKTETDIVNYKSLLEEINKDIKAEVNDEEIIEDVMLVNDGNVISYYKIELNGDKVEEAEDDASFIDDYELPGDEIVISHKDDDEMANDEVADSIFFEYIEGDGDREDGIDEEEYNKSHSESDDEGKFKRKSIACEKRGVKLSTVSEYRTHVTGHYGAERKFICEHCGCGFTSKAVLEEHQTTHEEDTHHTQPV